MPGYLLLLFPQRRSLPKKDYQIHERTKPKLRDTPNEILHGVIREYQSLPWYQRLFSLRVEMELGCLARAAEEILEERAARNGETLETFSMPYFVP